MSNKEKLKWVYRVVRSVLFTAVSVVAVLLVGVYITLSIPSVQRSLVEVGRSELIRLAGGDVKVGSVSFSPFNEIVLGDVEIIDPKGDRVARINRLGAGISLWNLIAHQRIIITYAELYGMDASISQAEKDGPLNIQYLIDAFKSKDKNKPPTKFELEIRNIVVRKCAASFDRKWQPSLGEDAVDFNHLRVTALNADVVLPKVSESNVEIDLRRLAFNLAPNLEVKRITAYVAIRNGDISVRDIAVATSDSQLAISDIDLPLKSKGGFSNLFKSENFRVSITSDRIVPADFRAFYPPLSRFGFPFSLNATAEGNAYGVSVGNLDVVSQEIGFSLHTSDISLSISDGRPDDVGIGEFRLRSSAGCNATLAERLPGSTSQKLTALLRNAGNIDVNISGKASVSEATGELIASVISDYGNVDIEADLDGLRSTRRLTLNLKSDKFDAGKILSTDRLGNLTLDFDADLDVDKSLLSKPGLRWSLDDLKRKVLAANADLELREAQINGYNLTDLALSLEKSGETADVNIDCTDENLDLSLAGRFVLQGADSGYDLEGTLRRIRPAVFGFSPKGSDYIASTDLIVRLTGNSPDNLAGNVNIRDLTIDDVSKDRSIHLNNVDVVADITSDGRRRYQLLSDWIAGEIKGDFVPSRLPYEITSILAEAYPDYIKVKRDRPEAGEWTDYLTYDFTVYPDEGMAEMFHLPVKLLYQGTVTGLFDNRRRLLSTDINLPYIQQGKDKLVQKTHVAAAVSGENGTASFYTSYPTKKGVLDLQGNLHTQPDNVALDLDFNPGSNGKFYGKLSLEADIHDALNPTGRNISARVLPAEFYLNGARWDVAGADVLFDGTKITVNGMHIGSGDQYLTIAGVASASDDDEIVVTLNNVDLDYIFSTLNINYVTFGGIAKGDAIGKGLLSGNPKAFTRDLKVRDLSYNGAVLGDGDMTGEWDNVRKRVGIGASISEDGRHCADVNGGVWIGRDSLAFDIGADKVRIGFLQPFMSAFSSDVKGRASGDALLFGTFKDVNMAGRLYADTISLKVDYTNVTYCGSDSVIIDPGHIRIPPMTLRDEFGHTATLSGDLHHNYFHDPSFEFRVDNARSIMLYDTNSRMNPVWYGRIFGSGMGRIIGWPGKVSIIADMTTQDNSTFTFVLDEAKEAAQYNFLTFTDKAKARKELEAPRPDTPDEIVAAFRKKVEEQQGDPSTFEMDIRASLTPAAKLTLVMDPKAGDKITATGSGPMNITYNSESDDMKMFGKYTISEGVYNFSFQDLILKDFIIKEGSNISFNGSPYSADLDIRAAYRVNTNLADLDKSFSTDRDLNRTNVPVDAMLLVRGAMEHPDISFDIELPTLNDEVARKVRSIISSEDMMNRQMIYLLALNRFYTPEYMGGSNSGTEWTSVASSTLSSQLTNILDQLTDKVSVAPSLRSDKGDFSDVEVDLALSSRLFNNRLLINGNFGYRDRSTSSTTFIGDFDVEYLLNRSGNFRLKAYNHFNDQNYYLKSALTTQGVGIIWRKDFDHFIFRPRKKKNKADNK